jgi:hypothetical protein
MSSKTSVNSDEIALVPMPAQDGEEIFMKGPLEHELLVHVKRRDRSFVKVHYRYVVDESTTNGGDFSWNYTPSIGKCSTRCGGGVQETRAVSVQ